MKDMFDGPRDSARGRLWSMVAGEVADATEMDGEIPAPTTREGPGGCAVGRWSMVAGVLALQLVVAQPIVAQVPDRESEMFGEESTDEAAPTQDENANPEGTVTAPRTDGKGEGTDRETDMFGGEPQETTVSEGHRALLEEDKLQLGGMMYMRTMGQFYTGFLDDPSFAMPNLLDVYLDGRPGERVRAFVRGRLKFDPLPQPPVPGFPRDVGKEMEALAKSLGQEIPARDGTDVLLDQFWLKFDVARTLFVTAGRQPIQWGTTRLWNPTDLVNRSRREPLALFDERTGVTALKIHLPIESLAWNVVGLLLLDDADSVRHLGGALRLEAAFSSVELGLTGLVRREMSTGATDSDDDYVLPQVGLDLSAGIWDIDLTAEAGLRFADSSRNDPLFEAGDRKAILQAAVGASYTIKYSTEDYLIVGGEYFFNPEGYSDSDIYPKLLMEGIAASLGTDGGAGSEAGGGTGTGGAPSGSATQSGAYTPFYLGQHYAALYALLPSPGNWDFTSFSLSGVGNLSDESVLVRLDYSVTVLTWLSLQAWGAVNLGHKGGEFRFGFEEGALPYVDGTSPEFYQAFSAGLNLRVNL